MLQGNQAESRIVRCIANEYNLDVREIRWTDKSEDHIAAHNITPEEVEQVIYTRPRWYCKGPKGRSMCSAPPTRAGTCWPSWPSRPTGGHT